MSRAIDLPDCWGVDTNTKITPEIAKKLAASTIHQDGIARPIRFVWRYVHFGPALGGDIDADEAKVIEDAGLALLLVQHCRFAPWAASGKRGAEDAKYAVENAEAAGYLEGCSLAIDLEGVANPGQAAIDHANAWAEVIEEAGYSPTDYIGFDSGMTADEHFERLPRMHRYFGAAGSWNVSKRGLCCRQYPTTTIAGIAVDPDHAYPDAFGGALRAMAADDAFLPLGTVWPGPIDPESETA